MEKRILQDEEPEDAEEIILHQRAYTHAQFSQIYTSPTEERASLSKCEKISKSCQCSKQSVISSIVNKLPIINTIRHYNVKEMLVRDILAGISVAVLHIPMGMGFALLASLTPIYGLYTSFFPVIMYALFGTSPHTSFGSNAIIAVMVAGIVERQTGLHTFSQSNITSLENPEIRLSFLDNQSEFESTYSSTTELLVSDERLHFQASVAAASSLVVGIILALMGLLHLGILSIFFSDPLVSGFTFGASLQIAVVQIPGMLGLRFPSRVGTFKLILTLSDIFRHIKSTNVAALVISTVCLIVLILIKELINKRFQKKLPVPVPIDFILVLVSTIISHFAKFSERFHLPIVNKVPTGLIAPTLPEVKVIPAITADSFVIAILVFALSMSLAKLLAKQMHYNIDENQELFAYGASNILGGFFQCFPSCQAPPRAMVAVSMKARTTLTGMFSALVLLVVLLVLGQYMAALPICVLAAMIIVSLTGLFRNIFDTKRFWILNKLDFTIWVITAIVTVIVDIDKGLYVGVGISLIIVVLQTRKSSAVVLGRAKTEDYILDLNSSNKVQEIPGVKMFQFRAPLYFGNAEVFRERLYALTVNPEQLPHRQNEIVIQPENAEITDSTFVKEVSDDQLTNGKAQKTPLDQDSTNEKDLYTSNPLLGHQTDNEVPVKTIILDLSQVNFIDSTGLKTVELVVKTYDLAGIYIVFAGCNVQVYSSLKKGQFFSSLPNNRFAHDIHAAIVLSQINRNA